MCFFWGEKLDFFRIQIMCSERVGKRFLFGKMQGGKSEYTSNNRGKIGMPMCEKRDGNTMKKVWPNDFYGMGIRKKRIRNILFKDR